MFPNPNPHNRRSRMLSGEETVVGRLISPNGTYVANPYPTTSAIGGTGAYGAMYTQARTQTAPMAPYPMYAGNIGNEGNLGKAIKDPYPAYNRNPGAFAPGFQRATPYPGYNQNRSVGVQVPRAYQHYTNAAIGNRYAGPREAPDKDPFAVPPTMGAETVASGRGQYGERRDATLGQLAKTVAGGGRPPVITGADAGALGFDRQSLLQAGYSFDPVTGAFKYGGTQAGASEGSGYSGERGDKFSPWGGESQAVTTQSKDGEVTAGYLQKYSSGRAANYGKRGNKWKTIVSGGVKMTVPDRGRGSGKRRNKEARGEGVMAAAAPVAEQIASFGLVDMGLRLATG